MANIELIITMNNNFTGGQETTAMVNACVIFMLAHHQNIQNKANYIYIYIYTFIVRYTY